MIALSDRRVDWRYIQDECYDPAIGRVASVDLFEGVSSDPTTLHKYMYASANPVFNADPSGRFSLSISVSGLLSAATWAGFASTAAWSIFTLSPILWDHSLEQNRLDKIIRLIDTMRDVGDAYLANGSAGIKKQFPGWGSEGDFNLAQNATVMGNPVAFPTNDWPVLSKLMRHTTKLYNYAGPFGVQVGVPWIPAGGDNATVGFNPSPYVGFLGIYVARDIFWEIIYKNMIGMGGIVETMLHEALHDSFIGHGDLFPALLPVPSLPPSQHYKCAYTQFVSFLTLTFDSSGTSLADYIKKFSGL